MNYKLWGMGVTVAFFCALVDALGVYLAAETLIWGKVIAFAIIKGAGGAALYMKQHPVEALNGGTEATKNPPGLVGLLLLTLCLGAVVAGCAGLKPGEDPIVVNAERLETTADGAFTFVKNVDDADRGFYRTNAPAFHEFVEWLRTPIRMEGTNVIRRGPAMILAVNSAKHSYQQNHFESNLLTVAVNSLSAAVLQAQSWKTIIQTPTPK